MPRRDLSQTSFFSPEVADPSCLEVGGLPWLFRNFSELVFPAWLFDLWHGHGRRGRGAWPAAVLVTALVLGSAEGGMPRRAMVRRLRRDTAWRAACGLEIGGDTPDEATFRRFEKYLRYRDPSSGVPRYLLLHEHWVRLCLEEGVVDKPCWTQDSTPMWCYGATRDTLRMLGDGVRSLCGKWARLTGQRLEDLAHDWDLPLLLAKSTKGYFRVDWRNAEARAAAIDEVARAVLKVVDEIRPQLERVHSNQRKKLLRRCRNLVRVVECDLETDEAGRLVVARRVAADRSVSITDPQARHGRKTKSQLFKGFKVHLLGDVVSGLIASLSVTPGNIPDGRPAHRLIRRAKRLYAELSRVMGDTAYGGAELHQTVRILEGVDILAPPPQGAIRSEGLTAADFDVDLPTNTATCPAGVSADLRCGRGGRRYFRWSSQECGSCALREACFGESQRSKLLVLHPQHEELVVIRQRWEDPEIRDEYRTRSQCERLVNQVVRNGGRQARAFGLQSATLQAYVAAGSSNLALLAKALARSLEVADAA